MSGWVLVAVGFVAGVVLGAIVMAVCAVGQYSRGYADGRGTPQED